MTTTDLTVFIVDDNLEICETLQWLFESVQLKVETYDCAQKFLDSYNFSRSGCLIIDVCLPLMSGLELLEHLRQQNSTLPVIIMSGYGDIAMAVRAMKAGAVDFISKPFNEQELLETIQKYLTVPQNNILHSIKKKFSKLTTREYQVLNLIIQGKLNKEISFELSISQSTVEAHRSRIMQKLEVKTVAALTKIFLMHKNSVAFID